MKRTAFEHINAFTLDLISMVLPVFPLRKRSTIICYHSVGTGSWRFTTNYKEFKKQIEYIAQNYTVVPLAKFLTTKPKYNHVAITFDDGYKDVIRYALPVLEENNMVATMFVLGEHKRANRKELDNKLPLINFREISSLRKKGWEIGFHTDTHANLGILTDKELEKEIITSKKRLEKKLGASVRYFAYPRGIYNEKIVRYVKKAGFKAAFTIDAGVLNYKNMYLIPRMPMEGLITKQQFEAFVSAPGQLITGIFMEVLKKKLVMQESVKKLVLKAI